MWRITLVVGLFFLAPAFARAQSNEASLESLSLDEIFRLGSGEASTSTPARGFLNELAQRPRREVLAMARARLSNNAFAGQLRDGFIVRVLRMLRPVELGSVLLHSYPRLDPGGRYEVLVYGVHERVEALAPLYLDVLRARGAGPVERESFLAAEFATEFPLHNLLDPLEALAAAEPEKLVETALRRVRAARLHREMSTEERAVLRDLRRAIFVPPRFPVVVHDLPVTAARSELERIYGIESDARLLSSADVQILDRRVSIREDDASAAEAFAAFCNQTGLSTLHGYHVSAGHVGAPALTRNHTIADKGLVLKAEPRAWTTGDVSIGIGVSSPEKWFPIWRVAFYLTELRLHGGLSVPQPPEYSARLGVVRLPVDEREWNELGRRIDVLEGELAIPVPTTIRRVQVAPQPGRTVREIVDDIFFVEITTSAENDGRFQVDVRYGTDLVEVVDELTTVNLGTVELFDEYGTSLEEFTSSSGHQLNFRTRGYRRSPLPAQLVWTFAPLNEIHRMRARWENIHVLEDERP